MTRLDFGGAELDSVTMDGLTAAGTVSINRTTKRSGDAAFEHPGSDSRCIWDISPTANVYYFARFCFYFAANPAVAMRIASWSTTTNYQGGVTLIKGMRRERQPLECPLPALHATHRMD